MINNSLILHENLNLENIAHVLYDLLALALGIHELEVSDNYVILWI
jgi:hypothetical protein